MRHNSLRRNYVMQKQINDFAKKQADEMQEWLKAQQKKREEQIAGKAKNHRQYAAADKSQTISAEKSDSPSETLSVNAAVQYSRRLSRS